MKLMALSVERRKQLSHARNDSGWKPSGTFRGADG